MTYQTEIISPLLSTVTVANTTTETTVYTGTIPANSLMAEEILKLYVHGKASTNSSSDSLTIRIKVGGVTKQTHVMTPKLITDEDFDIEGIMIQRTIGASGSRANHTHISVGTDSGFNNGVGTIDTTSDCSITVTVQWNNANASNTVSVYFGFIERKNRWI